jgi:hypothetical protein
MESRFEMQRSFSERLDGNCSNRGPINLVKGPPSLPFRFVPEMAR